MTARGLAWQAQLDRLHDRYARDGTARIWRTCAPVRVLADRGATFEAAWAGNGPPDYLGVLGNSRAISFDAKDCAGSRFPLSQIERHQARDLEAMHLRGGHAGIALCLAGDAYWLDWTQLGPIFWAWFQRSGRAGRGEASLQPAAWWRPFDVASDGWVGALGVGAVRAPEPERAST